MLYKTPHGTGLVSQAFNALATEVDAQIAVQPPLSTNNYKRVLTVKDLSNNDSYIRIEYVDFGKKKIIRMEPGGTTSFAIDGDMGLDLDKIKIERVNGGT